MKTRLPSKQTSRQCSCKSSLSLKISPTYQYFGKTITTTRSPISILATFLLQITERNIYMDDLYKTVSTPAEATILNKELQTMFSRRGFNLKKWTYNYEDFLRTINKNEIGNSDSLTSVERPLERFLGIKLKPDKSLILVEAKKFQTIDKSDLTQRKLLKFFASIFDPFGLTMPLTIRLQKFFQLAWNTRPQLNKPLKMKDLNEWIDQFNDICCHGITSTQVASYLQGDLGACPCISCLLQNHLDRQYSGSKNHHRKSKSRPSQNDDNTELEIQAATNGAKLARFVK